MESYFASPDAISLGILIVDARHAPTADDVTMSDYFKNSGVPYIILANKIDKVKPSQKENNLNTIIDTLRPAEGTIVLPFSAETGENRTRLISEIEKYV